MTNLDHSTGAAGKDSSMERASTGSAGGDHLSSAREEINNYLKHTGGSHENSGINPSSGGGHLPKLELHDSKSNGAAGSSARGQEATGAPGGDGMAQKASGEPVGRPFGKGEARPAEGESAIRPAGGEGLAKPASGGGIARPGAPLSPHESGSAAQHPGRRPLPEGVPAGSHAYTGRY